MGPVGVVGLVCLAVVLPVYGQEGAGLQVAPPASPADLAPPSANAHSKRLLVIGLAPPLDSNSTSTNQLSGDQPPGYLTLLLPPREKRTPTPKAGGLISRMKRSYCKKCGGGQLGGGYGGGQLGGGYGGGYGQQLGGGYGGGYGQQLGGGYGQQLGGGYGQGYGGGGGGCGGGCGGGRQVYQQPIYQQQQPACSVCGRPQGGYGGGNLGGGGFGGGGSYSQSQSSASSSSGAYGKK